MAWSIALDVIEDVRGSIAMFLFIIEEAIQTAGMACYILMRLKKYDELRDQAQWAIDNLINPALDFVQNYGFAAYPLNLAYESFYKAAKRTFETYLKIQGTS